MHAGCVALLCTSMHAGESLVSFDQGQDIDRTVGLFTDYVGTMDFTLAEADAKFLKQVRASRLARQALPSRANGESCL